VCFAVELGPSPGDVFAFAMADAHQHEIQMLALRVENSCSVLVDGITTLLGKPDRIGTAGGPSSAASFVSPCSLVAVGKSLIVTDRDASSLTLISNLRAYSGFCEEMGNVAISCGVYDSKLLYPEYKDLVKIVQRLPFSLRHGDVALFCGALQDDRAFTAQRQPLTATGQVRKVQGGAQQALSASVVSGLQNVSDMMLHVSDVFRELKIPLSQLDSIHGVCFSEMLSELHFTAARGGNQPMPPVLAYYPRRVRTLREEYKRFVSATLL